MGARRGPADGYFETTDKLLTRRGVLWLGQTCNLRCHFCYFLDRIEDVHHPEHRFMDLDKAKAICLDLRQRYGNTAVDIQGGEPTIWRHIDALVAYCAEIGLQPTLITNGVALADRERCARLQAAGLRDLKVSVQGIGATHDRIVQRAGSWPKLLRALHNCAELGIPMRINCVLSAAALPQLVDVARLAVDCGALAVNFLAFNPFEDQHEGRRSADNVPRYADVGAALGPALDFLAEAGVEANVRYLPFCVVPERHRASVYDLQQLSYDAEEWDFDSWSWTTLAPQRMSDGPPSAHHPSLAALVYADEDAGVGAGAGTLSGGRSALSGILRRWPALHEWARRAYWRRRARRRVADTGGPSPVPDELGRSPQVYRDDAVRRARGACAYEHAPACEACSLRRICDGFHSDYSSMFGVHEAHPIDLGVVVDDPLHFASAQVKVYEPEERARPFSTTRPFERIVPAPRWAAVDDVDSTWDAEGAADGEVAVPVALGPTHRTGSRP